MRTPARLVRAALSRRGFAIVLAAGVSAAVPAVADAGTRVAGVSDRHVVATATALAGSWRLLPSAPPVSSPYPGLTVTAWTGTQMIVHGIRFSGNTASGITLAYRPATAAWRRLPNGPRPLQAQGGDATVWTGSQLLVAGLTSGAYRPSANTWRPIARPPFALSGITGWTGHEALYWEGVCCGSTVNRAAAYNPVDGTWRILRAPLDRRVGAMGAWTGKLLVIAGGFQEINGTRVKVFRDGAAYDPATGAWRRLPPMPQRRGGGTAVWDGKEVLFLGGTAPGSKLPALRPMAYNPQTDRWRLLPVMEFRREGFAAVWTGRQVLVWGGQYQHAGTWSFPARGEAYDPATNRWTRLPASPLHGRQDPSAVWTGRQMIVWGGYYVTKEGRHVLLDGAAFTPRAPRAPERRQLAATTLSAFKVVLTATRTSRFDATVTAAGYRHTARGWTLIAVRQIGKAAAWSWYATAVCDLKVRQLKPAPSSATPADSITVNLLWGPAIGCLGPYTEHWKP